jgi:DNA repair photolyase
MPVLPFINDSIEDIEEIVEKAAEAGASYVLPLFGVTLRRGSRDYFYDRV